MKLKEIYWKIRDIVFWKFLVHIQWMFFNRNKLNGTESGNTFTIVVTTYISRYETYFKKLIKELTSIFPDFEIVVTANGYYDEVAQKDYLSKLKAELDQYQNVGLITFLKPEGLCKLWNTSILNAKNETILILNDDIHISPGLRNDLLKMDLKGIQLVNNSWSHFFINKDIIKSVGWFDERFEEIGNEDQDYEFRLSGKGITIGQLQTNQIRNIVDHPKEYSFGKEFEKVNSKYSAKNLAFLKSKWQMFQDKQTDMVYSQKFNIWFNPKPNFETPDFYPEQNNLS